MLLAETVKAPPGEWQCNTTYSTTDAVPTVLTILHRY